MTDIDPKNLRFLALLSAPLFALLNAFLTSRGWGVVSQVTQDMLIGSVMTYVLGSHGKEAIVARAQLAADAARAKVVPGAAADAILDAAAKGAP